MLLDLYMAWNFKVISWKQTAKIIILEDLRMLQFGFLSSTLLAFTFFQNTQRVLGSWLPSLHSIMGIMT